MQDELAAFKAEQAMLNGTEEMQHAELLRMKEEALHYRYTYLFSQSRIESSY